MRSLLTLSGTRIAALIRRREVSSREAVDAHIAQIEDVNPALNAVVCRRFDEARAEADLADERIAAGERDLPPFHGVPCTIKECFALTGMPNTAGLVAYRGPLADHDAVAVARLRAAGAIPLGVTNTSELCMWMESNNRVYGRTNNPYDLGRIPGGSSGGEGAIIGAGASPFGLGSDIGGSIRMPAFFNGVFGHKPTGGLVDNTGQLPTPPPGVLTYLATGPLARRAEDLAPLLTVLAATPSALREKPEDVDLSRLRVITIPDNGRTPVDPVLREAQARCARALERRGARVEEARLPGLAQSFEIWSAMLDAADGPSFSSLLGRGTPIDIAHELTGWFRGSSPHTFPALLLALFEKIPKLMPERGRAYVVRGHALRQELCELLGPDGVMLYPSYATLAPRHVEPFFPPFNWVYTAILNVMEIPVTQVPLGLGPKGLPLGVQVGAVHGNDHLTIAVGLALEKEFGGWVPPRLARIELPR
jgi:fatty acid amide hydrolase 2